MVEYKLNSEKKKKVVTEEVDNILLTSLLEKKKEGMELEGKMTFEKCALCTVHYSWHNHNAKKQRKWAFQEIETTTIKIQELA